MNGREERRGVRFFNGWEVEDRIFIFGVIHGLLSCLNRRGAIMVRSKRERESAVSPSNGWEVAIKCCLGLVIKPCLGGFVAIERNVLSGWVIAIHFALIIHHLDSLYIREEPVQLLQEWSMTTTSSNLWSGLQGKKLEALFGILAQHNAVSGIRYAVCFATGGEIGCFRRTVLWLRSSRTVGNFKIGQIDTKAAFLNGLLTFGNSIPINHNLRVLSISIKWRRWRAFEECERD